MILPNAFVAGASKMCGLWYTGNAALARMHNFGKPPVIYLGDSDWVLSTIGNYIREHLGKHYAFGPSFAWRGIRNSIVHAGSPPPYLDRKIYTQVHPSNKQVMSWTHGQRSNPDPVFARRLDDLHESKKFLAKIVTHSKTGLDTLIAEGIEPCTLAYIPHGVDRRLFHPPTHEQRVYMRNSLGVPDSAYCIGLFQKDGEGWGEGNTPKWVKGPDVFLRVIRLLRQNYELYVLLTSPARGYVKKGLEEMGVQYRHVELKDYREVAKHYWALDMYIIASRDEGGPMAVPESMASCVPLVSTRVGMAADVLRSGHNGFLTEVDDVEALAEAAALLLENDELRHTVAENALQTAQRYEWSAIADKYHHEVYRPLLLQAGYDL